MPRYAMVDGAGLITNVVLWDGNEQTWQPPAGTTMVADPNSEAMPGGTYKDGTFSPPPEPPPDPDEAVKDNITSAPDNLTGGPTLAEVFNVHV